MARSNGRVCWLWLAVKCSVNVPLSWEKFNSPLHWLALHLSSSTIKCCKNMNCPLLHFFLSHLAGFQSRWGVAPRIFLEWEKCPQEFWNYSRGKIGSRNGTIFPKYHCHRNSEKIVSQDSNQQPLEMLELGLANCRAATHHKRAWRHRQPIETHGRNGR